MEVDKFWNVFQSCNIEPFFPFFLKEKRNLLQGEIRIGWCMQHPERISDQCNIQVSRTLRGNVFREWKSMIFEAHTNHNSRIDLRDLIISSRSSKEGLSRMKRPASRTSAVLTVSRSCRVFVSSFVLSDMIFKHLHNFHDCVLGDHESSTFGLENQRRPHRQHARLSELL